MGFGCAALVEVIASWRFGRGETRRVGVRAEVDARPPVLPHHAGRGLFGRYDGDGADDGVRGEAGAVLLLHTDAVLDQDNGRAGTDERRDELRIIRSVGEGFGCNDDKVPFCFRCVGLLVENFG